MNRKVLQETLKDSIEGSLKSEKWTGSKWGLVLYCLGTFAWSLKGFELGNYGLVLISVLPTAAIFAGVILL